MGPLSAGWRWFISVAYLHQENCPLCTANNKARYVGAFRIIHVDNVEKGKTSPTPREKIFIKGVNTLEVLERKNAKKPLTSENLEVERIGDGFETQYTFEWTGDAKLPKDYIKPDSDDLKEFFKPQVDVMKRLANASKDDDSEPDDEEPTDGDIPF